MNQFFLYKTKGLDRSYCSIETIEDHPDHIENIDDFILGDGGGECFADFYTYHGMSGRTGGTESVRNIERRARERLELRKEKTGLTLRERVQLAFERSKNEQ